MIKVKFFCISELFRLEELINDFIKNKKVVDVKFEVSAGAIFDQHYALIIYEED